MIMHSQSAQGCGTRWRPAPMHGQLQSLSATVSQVIFEFRYPIAALSCFAGEVLAGGGQVGRSHALPAAVAQRHNSRR